MNQLIQALRRALAQAGIKVRNELVWGYGHCGDYSELHELYHVVKLLRDQELVGEKCLCQEEKNKIISRVRGLLGPDCHLGSSDFKRESRADADKWILRNPDCVAYDYVADYIQAQCKKIGIDFKIIERKCADVGIEIKITDKTVCDAIDLAIDIEKRDCNFDVDLDVDLQQCIIDVNTILAQTGCDIDLQTYVKKISCGATLKTVIEELDCGANVGVEVGDAINCPISNSPSASSSISPSSSASPSRSGSVSASDSVSPSASNSPSSSESSSNSESASSSISSSPSSSESSSASVSVSPSPSPEFMSFDVLADDTTICYYTDVTLSLDNISHEGATYAWNFGSGATPTTATGEGPHTIQYTTAGAKTVTVTATLFGFDSTETLNIIVSSCPGNISGHIYHEDGSGFGSVNVKLFADANGDGISDGGAAIKSVNSNSGGAYSMVSVVPGNYVIVVTIPGGFSMSLITQSKDYTLDGDTGTDISLFDNVIPVTITPSKLDADNNFYLSTP